MLDFRLQNSDANLPDLEDGSTANWYLAVTFCHPIPHSMQTSIRTPAVRILTVNAAPQAKEPIARLLSAYCVLRGKWVRLRKPSERRNAKGM